MKLVSNYADLNVEYLHFDSHDYIRVFEAFMSTGYASAPNFDGEWGRSSLDVVYEQRPYAVLPFVEQLFVDVDLENGKIGDRVI